MAKTIKSTAVIDLPDVSGAFVGNTLRPFTREEFSKLKSILAQKRRRNKRLVVTNRDLRAAGLGHLISESENSKPRK